MPPANSPTDTPSGLPPAASASSLLPLATTPPEVPDLDSILMSHPEDDIHNDNVRFLRSRRTGSAFQHARMRRMNSYETEVPNNLRDALDRRRAQNSSGTTRRIPVVRRPRENDGPNYDGASSSQAIFGLVPEDEEDPNESNNMESLVDEMWHSRFPRGERSPQISQPQIDEQMLEPFMSSIPYGRATSDLLESVRRQSRLPSNVRPPYLPDNTDDQETERERRPVPWTTTSGTRPGAVRTAFPLHLTEARNAHVREMYIKDPSAHRLKEAIKYLDRVRFSSSYEESLTEAAVGGFVQLEYFLHNEDDFILNTGFISNPPECSWLRPGAVLSGFQQATHNAVPTRSAAPTRPTDPVIVNGSDPNRIAVGTSSGRRYWARNSADLGDGPTPLTEPKTEQWPVKVTIHDIDPNSMTLSATMEAYNIPDKSDPDQKSHIITYVEGEIIDFNTHTLQTKNFKAGADIDTCYWKKLEPFKGMTPDEIVKNLISKKWITEYLAKGWILMRWKERCFVSPSHDQQGLTISGFYYVSMRRDNGHIEGMYHDSGSSPFQQLKLEPEMKQRMVFPAYGFR